MNMFYFIMVPVIIDFMTTEESEASERNSGVNIYTNTHAHTSYISYYMMYWSINKLVNSPTDITGGQEENMYVFVCKDQEQ
jgi:hypothetical protein